ncbi:hypothetical protein NM688_g7866 [Phlebia brevispora]|uniref:Uncharacterized protein n=1 Tax=Phlebia brevispora TaxID=194682 RepID=A0ACC1S083_9APHY|nr:hypothetical protein NM688_g7866 [Phlebia brevispora]
MLQQPSFSSAGPPNISSDAASSLPFTLDSNTAKQMAALQATSLAKVANRSAPGGVTSASYFGGLSAHQLSRPDSSSSSQETSNFPFPGLSNLQTHGPSTNPQGANLAAMQQHQQVQSQRKRSFLNAGKDIDLFKLWAVAQQAGSGQKLTQTSGWGHLLSHFDLPEQFTQPNGQQQPTALALQQYYNVLLGPFEEIYRKNMVRERAAAAARNQAAQMPGSQSRPASMGGMPGTFPPVGTLPAISGHNGLGMMGQPVGGGPVQSTDPSFGGMNAVPFSGPQGPSISQHQMANNMNNVQGLPDMGALNGIAPSTSQTSDMNGSSSEQDVEGRKRKLEEADEGKRAKHKSGKSI